jgi:hypothetical protein
VTEALRIAKFVLEQGLQLSLKMAKLAPPLALSFFWQGRVPRNAALLLTVSFTPGDG